MTQSRGEPPAASELWQRLLLTIDEQVNAAVLHPLDHAAVVRHLQNLHRVGERPTYEEFADYLKQLWPPWPRTRKRVRGVWRTILRDPHHRFRLKQGEVSLATLDRLATRLSREFGSPPLDWRALDVLKAAEKRFARVALEDPDLETFLAAQRELRTAMRTLKRVRELRLGYRSTGNWIELPADEVSLDELKAWGMLHRRYGRD